MLLLFALTVCGLVLAMNVSLALTWQLVRLGLNGAVTGYPAYFFTVNTGLTLLFVLDGWWLETSSLEGEVGGEKLARRAGARETGPVGNDAERRFCNIIDELAIAASMAPPQAMVLERVDAINAFAAVWHTDDAVVAVTRGALDHLTRDELQGLVAHEFSHIREGDTRLNMHLAGMVLGLELIFNLGRHMCSQDDDGHYPFTASPGLAVMACGSLGWLGGRVLKAATSRQREFLAYARAVQFTRSKDGLGCMLRKVAGEGAALSPRQLNPAVQHTLLVGAAGGDKAGWLAAHPALSERIRRIYGRPTPPMPLQRDVEPTRSGALF